ncbi:MAG: hypothetical protein LBU83_08935 [Bacteroidales bacterium]|jgi:hypothetical protein|nr:hypothetical protein [Bacteroidales bacterium]
MKKITLLLLFALLLATFALHAQKQFSGVIRFQTKMEGTDNPNLISSVETQTIDVSILGNKAKSVIVIEEPVPISMTNVWDGDKETSYFVIEITGMGKYYIKWNSEQVKDRNKFKEFKYSYEDDFKTICDFKCQKVTVTITNLEDDSQSEQILYVTKEIGTAKINGSEYPNLEGYPLLLMSPLEDFCEECWGVTEATKITTKKIKDVDFLLPDDAKNIDENPELKEQLQNMLGIPD